MFYLQFCHKTGCVSLGMYNFIVSLYFKDKKYLKYYKIACLLYINI